MGMRAVTDDPVRQATGEIDAHAESLVERDLAESKGTILVVVEERRGSVEPPQRAVGEGRRAREQPQLAQADAGLEADGKRLRRDLKVQGPVIARTHLIEAFGLVGDDARENVQTPRGALWVAATPHGPRKLQRFHERNDVDRTWLQGGGGLQ
jgi:hypothetical protein